MTPLVTGLNLATALIFDGDTAYVSNNSIEIPGVFSGEIVKIENFSSIQPLPTPAPQPTAAPVATPTRATGVTAPDTGTGPMGTDDTSLWLMALALGVAGVTMMGAALAYKRR
jgi:hypothetical protein